MVNKVNKELQFKNYKEKQQYYKNRSKEVKVFYESGKVEGDKLKGLKGTPGTPYVKEKEGDSN